MPPFAASMLRRRERSPAYYAVLTLDDLAPALAKRRMVREPGQGGKPRETMWPYPLAHGEVAFVGEPIAMVAAVSRYIAEDAAALVEVDYEILTPSPMRGNRPSPVRPRCGASFRPMW